MSASRSCSNDPAVRYHALVIERVVEETPDTRSLVLAVPPELRERFAYEAGQFLTFRVPWQGGALYRCYSLASCPLTDREWKVTVKRVEQGRVSNWMHDALGPGDRVEVLPPSGGFVLRPSERPLLLLAAGSGITPIISLAKSALASTRRTVRLLYANRNRSAIIFRAELGALARRHPQRFDLRLHRDDERGFLDAAAVRLHAAGVEEAEAYLCGPGPFMELAEEALLSLHFDPERILIERFESGPDGKAPQAAVAASEEPVPLELGVRLDGGRHRVPYRRGQSILEAVRAAGLDAPFACQEGHCGACCARCVQGEVRMGANEVLDKAELAEGWVLTCQGRACGPVCEIDYDA